MTAHDPHQPGAPGGYETRDVAFRPIVIGAVALVTIIVATFVLMRLLDRSLIARETDRSTPANPLAASYGRREPPAPRLQENPRRDLATLRAREREQLEGWGWVDRAAGRVHIPVEQAMARLLAEGPR